MRSTSTRFSAVSRGPSRLATLLWGSAAVLLVLGVFVLPDHLVRNRGVGDAAPTFSAAIIAPGEGLRTTSDYHGSVTLFEFWTTYCANCPLALRELERLHRELGPAGLRVVAVSLDGRGQSTRVREMVRDLGLTFENLHDPGGDAERAFEVYGVPTSVLVDRTGIVRRRSSGILPGSDTLHVSTWTTDDGRRTILELLKERPIERTGF